MRLRPLLLTSILLLAAAVTRAEVSDFTAFGRIPVLEDGRVMPVDTLARNLLLTCSGRSTAGGAPASAWLARVWFNPDAADTEAVFLINHPEVAEAIGLEAAGRHRYSFRDLMPRVPELRRLALAADKLEKGDRSAVEDESLRLFGNLSLYAGLRESFLWALPRRDLAVTDPTVRERLGWDTALAEAPPLLALLAARDRLDALVLEHRGEPASGVAGREVAALNSALQAWTARPGSSPVALIPIAGHAGDAWVSPDALLRFGGGAGGPPREMLDALASLASAHAEGKQALFDMAARRARRLAETAAPDPAVLRRLDLEASYNRIDPLYLSTWLYGCAFLTVLASIVLPARAVRLAGYALLGTAIAANGAGIVCRMLIMGRPPVTNLYATFVFVALVCALLGVAVEWFQRTRLGLLVASLSGLGLLLVSRRFAAEGDTMGVMVAVLDSNFWLATHVVCITIGYAGCVAAGLVGHVWLVQTALGRPAAARRRTFDALYGLLGFGLVFSFLGTMLGGVWADQSWGRFWGWDPKENGALLIVLWSAILFHARLAGLVQERGFAAGSVLGVLCVLAAWLGVNLLGVGLHSYGFTSSLAWGFFGTCAFEIAFLAIAVPLATPRAKPPRLVAAAVSG